MHHYSPMLSSPGGSPDWPHGVKESSKWYKSGTKNVRQFFQRKLGQNSGAISQSIPMFSFHCGKGSLTIKCNTNMCQGEDNSQFLTFPISPIDIQHAWSVFPLTTDVGEEIGHPICTRWSASPSETGGLGWRSSMRKCKMTDWWMISHNLPIKSFKLVLANNSWKDPALQISFSADNNLQQPSRMIMLKQWPSDIGQNQQFQATLILCIWPALEWLYIQLFNITIIIIW